MQLLDDNELVKFYIAGKEEALSVLVHRHKRRIFSYINLILKDHATSEDVFQETFFKVIQTLKRGNYSEEGKFLPWILRIARNMIIDHFRRVKKMPSIPTVVNHEGEETDIFSLIPAEEDNIVTNQLKKQTKKDIRTYIHSLPDEQKEVVIMRTYYDMSFKEIADITNVSINTSLGRMRYALINLKKMIEESKLEIYV